MSWFGEIVVTVDTMWFLTLISSDGVGRRLLLLARLNIFYNYLNLLPLGFHNGFRTLSVNQQLTINRIIIFGGKYFFHLVLCTYNSDTMSLHLFLLLTDMKSSSSTINGEKIEQLSPVCIEGLMISSVMKNASSRVWR